MSFSISPSTTFANIDWNTLENRPPIDKSMIFCQEKDWYDAVPCCMDGYTIEHVHDLAYENGFLGTAEAQFLNEYPCLNAIEMNHFYEKFTGLKAPTKPESCDNFLSKIFNGIKNFFR